MNRMNTQVKVYVAGHRGLVGSAIVSTLEQRGYRNLLTASRDQLDLADSDAVDKFFAEHRPDVVFLAAAKVGGIVANNAFRADFIYQNLQIQNNVIWSAFTHDVGRLIFLGSSCIYPRMAEQPIQEASLLTGPLEYTNRPYAVAKIAGVELVHSLHLQYGCEYFSAMPTNLFGPGDNFHPDNSHVIPGLIRRFHEAVQQNKPEIIIWGSGKPTREFMFSSDCAEALVYLAEQISVKELVRESECSHINVGTGEEISIFDLAQLLAHIFQYKGTLVFDTAKPDGTPRKLLDSSRLRKLGWRAQVAFEQRLTETVAWYIENCVGTRAY